MPSSLFVDSGVRGEALDDQKALHIALDHLSLLGLDSDESSLYDSNQEQRKKGVNMTECVPVPSSEHVAEIVGRQGCKIKALRAKTNTYIKTPVRGEEPVFVVTGRREDVAMARREIISAAEHFSMIRATRNKNTTLNGNGTPVPGPPNLPGQTTIQVRVPYRVVGLVVGPKGATIKRIQQQTHTYIVTPSRDKEPVFEVTGMPENVDRAREEIEAHIAMRTGGLIELQDENDFHANGTDVGLDPQGHATLWSKPSGQMTPTSVHKPFSNYRNDSSSSLGSSSPTSNSAMFQTNTSTNANGIVMSQQRVNGCIPQPRLSPPLHSNSEGPIEHHLERRVRSDPGGGSLSFSGYSSIITSLPGSHLPRIPCDSSASSSSSSSTSSGSSRKGSRDCSVCFESEVIAALVPCGHNLFCMACANRICERSEPKCPVCHTVVTQAI
ncbi:hypothetical protein INR49_002766, partial [Caranx melampygus]